MDMNNTPIKFHKSESYDFRLCANNGLDILDDAAYLSAAVDRNHDGPGYTVRFWSGRSCVGPCFTEAFDRQGDAKRVALAVLNLSLDAGDFDLRYWVGNVWHRTYMDTLYPRDEVAS